MNAEELIIAIEKEIVDNLNGTKSDICTISSIGDLIINYKSQR